jgi:ABC-type proline/glycine betaine transport system permease subunit
MSELKSVKETVELIEGMGEAAKIIKLIAKDGITAADLIHIQSIASALPIIKDAVEGLKEIPSELKDLDETEVLEIIAAIYGQAKKINEV